jgi:anti-sigma factor RsiW
MIECQQSLRLGAYLDGQMSPQERSNMQEHLALCAACVSELERLERLSDLLRSMPRAELDRAALARLHRWADRLPQRGALRLAETLAAVAAAVLVACCVGLAEQASLSAAQGPSPLWEAQAISQTAADQAGSSEEQLAMWLADDLSGKARP